MSRDAIEACLLAGAIGDALGASREGGAAGAAACDRSALPISDDTQLTLSTCAAILATGGVDPEAIAARFAADYRAGIYTGLGASTLKALRDLVLGAHWSQSGRRGEFAAGNGAAMRIAPLAFCLDPGVPSDRTAIYDVCRITHHHDEAYAGALAIVLALRHVLAAPERLERELLAVVSVELPDCRVRDAIRALASLAIDAPLAIAARRCGTSGFVAESVPLALYAAQRAPRMDLGVLLREVIALGGDTDTNAAFVGQIAGAALGSRAVPDEDRLRLAKHAEIGAAARAFAIYATRGDRART